MNALRNIFFGAFAATLMAACGGGDPMATPDATGPNVSTASHETALQRSAAGAPKGAPAPDRKPGAVLAGAAATQDAIDSAIAAHAAWPATDSQR